MTLDELQQYWNNRENIFRTEKRHSDRFYDLRRIVYDFRRFLRDYPGPDFAPFCPQKYGVTLGSGIGSWDTMRINYPKGICISPDKHQDLVDKSWRLIGGYDNGRKCKQEYRVVSNSYRGAESKATISIGGLQAKTNANFASNNWYWQIAKFMDEARNGGKYKKCVGKSGMVLTWPTNTYYPKTEKWINAVVKRTGKIPSAPNIEKHQFLESAKYLERRYISKHLWMWSKGDSVIRPFSLEAFHKTELFIKGLLKDPKIDSQYPHSNIANQTSLIDLPYDEFRDEWQKISDFLVTLVTDNSKARISERRDLSKLLSILALGDCSLIDLNGLINSGCKATILYGAPGTGKTFQAKSITASMLGIETGPGELDKELESYKFSERDLKLAQTKKYSCGAWQLVQFHPNYTYEDFIGGIRPQVHKSNSLSYSLIPGLFQTFCRVAGKYSKETPFIFIIDEINRADLSAVFGELLYALEYRDQPVQLPNFGNFRIPDNVYLLGTMNNVDKSLVTFDVALRRRFAFYRMEPELETLWGFPRLAASINKESIADLIRRGNELNDAICNKLHLSKEYRIGQAYFGRIVDFTDGLEINSFHRKKLWEYHLLPLLEEYLGMAAEAEEVNQGLHQLMDIVVKDNR